MAAKPTQNGNQLLESLSAPNFALMQSHLEPIALDIRKELEHPSTPIKDVYFLESGIASVVATVDRNAQSEVGLIGSEGVSGLAIILGSDRSPHKTFIQAAGGGHRMAAGRFRKLMAETTTLRNHFLRYANAFTIQVAETAAANARGNLEQRLARWILMAHDRLGRGDVALTHEFMAIMLGVRRAGVTESIGRLVRRGFIGKGAPGVLTILNRKGLETVAGRFYGVPEREYERLMVKG